jgi:enterochelin esterase family protein
MKTWALAVLLCCGPLFAQKPPDFHSTEIHGDQSVTFRYFDLKASRVELVLENHADRVAMQKGADGVWSATTGPLRPEIYGYRFAVDGNPRTVHDPQNQKRRYGNDLLLIPGKTPEAWEDAGAPRGAVERHEYGTKVVAGLPGDRSEYVVYTPPGYDPKAKPYPVLYLLHVWGDRPESWTKFGQANLILDNLIAQGKAKPMVVVMPLGYGDMKFDQDDKLWDNRAMVERNLRLFEKALLTEVMPEVESKYNVRKDSAGTAILGASMGGQESLVVGLGHRDRFGWIGGESAALSHQDFDTELPLFTARGGVRHPVWMICGGSDDLLESNQKFTTWLRSRGELVEFEQPEGTHSYIVWREGLVRFASRIF